MKSFTRHALSVGAASALLAGCGGSQLPIGAPGAMPQSHAIAAPPDRDGSWMLPEAMSEDLLYVSNVQNVTVYSYPRGRHVGTLRGFYRPDAECTDSAGEVFIDNGSTLVAYKHGGKTPIKTFTQSGYNPGGCASDPMTGNLAVSWSNFSNDQFNGYVAVYTHATGKPANYSLSGMVPDFCGYDSKGDLFVDGATPHGDLFKFAELPKNGNALMNISLNQNIGFGANVQWDGKYVTVEDSDTSKIYRFAIFGTTGTLKGTVSLEGATKYGLYETWIQGKKVVGADILSNTVWYWKYPTGGAAIKSITQHLLAPYGVTISKAPAI